VNRSDAYLPITLVAGNAAVAILAAVGAVFLLPMPEARDLSGIAVPMLTLAIGTGLFLGGRRIALIARNDALRRSSTDPATGLSTVPAADRTLSLEFAAAQRGRPLTVVLFQVNEIRDYASRHGQAVAEQLLRSAGRVLAKNRRRMHVAAHHGAGRDTFLAILSGMDVEGASIYARRMRREIMTLPGAPEPPSVAVGIAMYDMSMADQRDLVDQAQRALEKGCQAGGKVVVMQVPGAAGAASEDGSPHQYF
jgi:diguanylate cyclase (GGDEF)-like protein